MQGKARQMVVEECVARIDRDLADGPVRAKAHRGDSAPTPDPFGIGVLIEQSYLVAHYRASLEEIRALLRTTVKR